MKQFNYCADYIYEGEGSRKKMKPFFSSFPIEDVDLHEACVTVQTWKSSSAHFRLMYQEKLIQGSRLRRPPEANDLAGSRLKEVI